MAYNFTIGSLPKTVYTLLKAITQSEGMTQRQVVIAGVMALHRLRTVAPEHLMDLLKEAKRIAPRRATATPAE